MELLTIRQAAKRGPLTEYRLRQMVKENQVPGFRSGSRFLVNYGALVDLLDEQTRNSVQTVAAQ